VIEKRGRKAFSKGLWAPAENIARAKAALESERATDTYQKKQQRSQERRATEQSNYVASFSSEVVAFLRFAPRYRELAEAMAEAVTRHATPVGSGTVARTKRISVEERAEAAVIAWMRHQTTGYDNMQIARVKGRRREVRRELATISRAVLDLHRVDRPHPAAACPLCAQRIPPQDP
jgi:hypothetical protein